MHSFSFRPSTPTHPPPLPPVRVLCQFRKRITVRILPPYRPSAAEIADPSLYAANVRRLVADALSLPVVDQGYEEFAALLRAGVRVDAAPASVMTAEPEAWADEGAWPADVQRREGHR